MFSLLLCLFFMYYLCEKYYKPITVQYYIADCVGWVPRLCWTCEQTGLTNMLLKQNLFICRGLTVLWLFHILASSSQGSHRIPPWEFPCVRTLSYTFADPSFSLLSVLKSLQSINIVGWLPEYEEATCLCKYD